MIAPAALLPFIEETARAAGEVHLRYFRRLESVEKKGAIDLVTVADREAEAVVRDRIRARFPGHRLLMEESGASPGPEDVTWVVDPLDGTTNFAHGMRLFAVSIAVLEGTRPVAGCIHAAALDECYTASPGGGAWRNGAERLRVSTRAALADSLLVTGFPYDRARVLGPLMEMMGAALARSRGVLRLGAASLDMAAVAAGHLDGFYEFHLHPWDVAAGALLVEEAGGRLTDFEGRAYDVLAPRTTVATNGLVHAELLAAVTGPRASAFAAAT
ncbi:MAG: inositol monophosphatase family protein [Candidatus Sumerlaeia bacterium]|nr:inositol monophosphatase family protein [Candidatus Sumerlaeia bacterium]